MSKTKKRKIEARITEDLYQELNEYVKKYKCTMTDVVVSKLQNDSSSLDRKETFKAVMRVDCFLKKLEDKGIDCEEARRGLHDICTKLNS